MIIENPDAFKAWMTTVLEPLCDADPQALAKYIYALVKKDKPTDDLRKSMVAQLEVFLQKDTKPFVDFLFTKLESGLKEEYKYFITVKDEPVEQGESDVIPEQPVKEVQEGDGGVTEITNTAQQEETPQIISEVVRSVEDAPSEKPNDEPLSQASQDLETPGSPRPQKGSVTTPVKERTLSLSQSRDRKSDSERDDKERAYKVRRRNSSESSPRRQDRSRSRSRSWDRNLRRSRSRNNRSRSRGRDRIRAWRNKSPPRRYDRKMKRSWSWSKSPGRRSRSRSRSRTHSRSRSPIHSKEWYSRYRNRSPFERSPSGSRKRTPSPYDSPAKSVDDSPPTQDSSTGDDLRLSQGSQNSLIQSVVNVSIKEPFSKRSRCRDYEEKGFCMRGEMCPYDHGNDPVVLEDVGQVLSFSAPPPPSTLDAPSPILGMPMMRPTLSPGMTLRHPPHLMNRLPPNLSEYNPDAPSMEPRMWSKQQFRTTGRGMMRGGPMIRPPPIMPHHTRELISVPTGGENEPFYSPLTFGNSNKRQNPMDYSNGIEMPLKPRFDYTRLGNRRNNCSLQLKKIPPGLNNIAHLHNHFVKFGTIVNIQVNFEGDTEAALITFMSHAEASAAYKSTEAVLNNRFIKVFWYNPEKNDKQENISPAINRPSAKERLGVPINNPTTATFKHKENKGNEKVIVSGANITKTFYVSQENDKKPLKLDPKNVIVTTKFQTSQELLAAKEAIKKRKEQMRQEAISKNQELVQRKRDFLDNLIKRQEELAEKYEKGNFTPEQRCEILVAMKELHESIDSLRNSVGPINIKPGPSAIVVTPQLMKKSIEQELSRTEIPRLLPRGPQRTKDPDSALYI